MTTLADLLNPRTREGWRDELLSRLASLGFRATAWASGSVPRTLVELVAWGLTDVQAAIAAIASGVLLDLSTGRWLTLLARGHYDLDRTLSGFAEGTVALTCAAGAGPYSLPAGALWCGVQASGLEGALRFVSTEAVTVNPGGTASVRVKAESPGAAYNAPNGAVDFLFTPLPGLAVSNPAVGGTGTWLEVPGVDEEDDQALRDRCRAKWATLSFAGAVDLWYAFVARSAVSTSGVPAGVTRVRVVPGPGDGTLRVVCAGSAGPLGSTAIAWVQAYVNLRRPPTDAPTVVSASAVNVALAGALRVAAAQNTAANRAAVLAAITALQATLDIGEPIDEARVKATLYAAQPGLRDLDLTLVADVAIGDESIAAFETSGLSWVSV